MENEIKTLAIIEKFLRGQMYGGYAQLLGDVMEHIASKQRNYEKRIMELQFRIDSLETQIANKS